MISLEDGIKYAGLTAIIYFLIKAFADDKLGNTEICCLVLFIMVPIIFVCGQISKKKCQKRMEPFQITDPPVVPSIYPGPPNTDPVLGVVQVPPPLPASAQNQDVQDFKSIVPINLQTYDALLNQEDQAKNRIRQAYTNEMVFTETNPFNTVPLGTQLYGYTFLPPENWFRAYERPPICISNDPQIVRPIGEGNYVADLLEFDTRSNVPGPAPVTPRTINQNTNQPRPTQPTQPTQPIVPQLNPAQIATANKQQTAQAIAQK